LKRGLQRTSTCSSQHIGFRHGYLLHVGTPRMGAILQRGIGKHPQGIRLGNSHDHGTYPWWRGAESLIPFVGNSISGSLWIY
jgi:hypothetical protein